MDKPKLSRDQLLQLVIYIKRRGFTQTLVIAEILDHFACKVEEKMAAYPGISLERAMTDAHADFGISGFAPIVSAFQGSLKKRYADIYKAQVKKTLMKPIPVVLSVLAYLAFYNGYLWAGKNHYNHVAGMNDACFVLYSLFVISSLYFTIKFYSGSKTDLIKTAVFGNDLVLVFIIMFLLPMQNLVYGTLMYSIVSFIGSFASSYLVIRQYALFNSMAIGADESSLVENYLNGLKAT